MHAGTTQLYSADVSSAGHSINCESTYVRCCQHAAAADCCAASTHRFDLGMSIFPCPMNLTHTRSLLPAEVLLLSSAAAGLLLASLLLLLLPGTSSAPTSVYSSITWQRSSSKFTARCSLTLHDSSTYSIMWFNCRSTAHGFS